MALNTFLVSVADAIALNPSTGAVLFEGTANIESAFNLSMQSSDVRGGINNALLYKYMHTRDLEVMVTQATFGKDILALNVGSSIVNGSVNVMNSECITLSSDVGTLSETPIGDVNVIKADGTIVSVTPSGSTITVPSGGNTSVKAIYRYADTVDRITVGTTTPPTVITLILTAEVRNEQGTLIEKLQIEVPNFQVDGNYTLDLSADGVSQESLSGMALNVSGESCSSGDIYAYVSWIPQTGTAVPYATISASPPTFEPAVGDLPTTQQITVTGIRGGNYSNVNITDECTYAAVGDADITVGANTGLISVAGTGTATDSATITCTYTDGTTTLTDIVVVTITS